MLILASFNYDPASDQAIIVALCWAASSCAGRNLTTQFSSARWPLDRLGLRLRGSFAARPGRPDDHEWTLFLEEAFWTSRSGCRRHAAYVCQADCQARRV